MPPVQDAFLPLLLWQGLVDLTNRADTNQSSADRARAQTLAIDYAETFATFARARGFGAELVAGALHVRGYLASNAGRHADDEITVDRDGEVMARVREELRAPSGVDRVVEDVVGDVVEDTGFIGAEESDGEWHGRAG